jgi:hypothetical protein
MCGSDTLGDPYPLYIQEPPAVRAILSTLLPIALCMAVSAPAQAQTLTCKNDFASIGDSKPTILQKCGEPAMKDSFCKPTENRQAPAAGGGTVVNVMPCEKVEEWTYRPGYGQFITTLRFENGELKSMKYGDRIR